MSIDRNSALAQSTHSHPMLNLNAVAAPPVPYETACLTAESLFLFCQSRLGELDSQMKTMFAAQEKANKDNATISSLITSLNCCAGDGINMKTQAGCDLIGAVQHAINEVGPDTPAGRKLTALRDAITERMDPSHALTQAACNHTLWGKTGTDEEVIGQVGGERGEDITATTVQGWVTDAKGVASDISAGAELNMIQLQSVMSKRQTAIQLTTNLIQSLGDQANKIAANVGH
jgi:hypothetical protein